MVELEKEEKCISKIRIDTKDYDIKDEEVREDLSILLSNLMNKIEDNDQSSETK